MPRHKRQLNSTTAAVVSQDNSWPADTPLVGFVFELSPERDVSLFPQYAIGLHAWFLDQVRSQDPALSAYLHDGQSEKPFTVSRLEGNLENSGRQVLLRSGSSYRWYVTALSQPVAEWMREWLQNPPEIVELHNAPLRINSIRTSHPPTTYQQLWESKPLRSATLSFVSPTGFRKKGHHLPLPVPVNVFHSYLRRWNDFSEMPFDTDAFLKWVDEHIAIARHQVSSVKVAAGKRGSITGFTGEVEFCVSTQGRQNQEFQQLFSALANLAPYCGTGHKTPFGLGQTRRGHQKSHLHSEILPVEDQLAQRIEQLTQMLMRTQKRTGGTRAHSVCEIRATILARREFGESLQAIAQDLQMPYETVKSYVKLARRALKA
jgi:CRISPR-associated endoribonuclease Cas6